MAYFADRLNAVMRLDATVTVMEFDGQWYRWGDLCSMIEQIARLVEPIASIRDLRIGVMIRNHPSTLAAILSSMANEACMVSLNPLYPDDKLADDIRRLKLPVIIGLAADVQRPGIQAAFAEAGSAVICLSGVLESAALIAGLELPKGNDIQYRRAGVIIEMLTSGTTGTPKRVPLDRQAFDKSFIGAMSYEKGRHAHDKVALQPDTDILSNPLSHIGGLWAAITSVAAGRKSVLLEKFSVGQWHDAIRRHRPQVARAVPAALRMILDANLPPEDLSSVRAIRTGAAPLDPAIIKEFFERYRIPVLQNYGATEFAGAVAGWTLKDFYSFHDRKYGSVGRFQPGVTGRVVDEITGEEKASGQEGVLEMKAEQFGNDGAWLRTTDRAELDDDGFLYIKGRADSAIIRGGFKVHPDDLVKVLEGHPAVREAAAVGIPDRRLGAVPVAVILLRPGAGTPTEQDLIAYAKERLLPYQVPTAVRILDEMPRTASMKPALQEVRRLFMDID